MFPKYSIRFRMGSIDALLAHLHYAKHLKFIFIRTLNYRPACSVCNPLHSCVTQIVVAISLKSGFV